MVTPARGDFAGVPLNAGRAQARAGVGSGEGRGRRRNSAEAYGAPADHARARAAAHHLARRHHAEDGDRRRHADAPAVPLRRQAAAPRPRQPSWQGYSSATWEGIARGPGEPDFLPIALNPREGTRGRSLEVVTTNLRPGYLRKNGVPYSARTTLKEYFDVSDRAQRRHVVRGDDDRRGPRVPDHAVRHQHELQEAARRHRLESHALLRSITRAVS